MLLQIVGTLFNGSWDIEGNTLSHEKFVGFCREKGYSIDPETQLISYSFKTEAGRTNGNLEMGNEISCERVVVTIQPRETKARYDEAEVKEVIEEAKAALSSMIYRQLYAACRNLRQVSEEVKKEIGNYTNYSIEGLASAIERALVILEPQEVDVDVEKLVQKIEDVDFELQKVLSDLAFVANHFNIVLPQHAHLFKG